MKRRFALLLIIALCISLLPQIATRADAATFTNEKYKKVAELIDNYGSSDTDGMYLVDVISADGYDFYFFLQNRSEGLCFSLLMDSALSDCAVTLTEFVLTDSSNIFTVNHIMQLYYNDECVDEVYTSVRANKVSYTADSNYGVYKSGTYISSGDFSDSFHTMLSLLISYWDTALYTNLCFGMKALGFSSYAGNEDMCDHTYDNTCDTTCNCCAATRTITHSYGSYYKLNNIQHSRTCTVCGQVEYKEHTWDAGVVTKQATCGENGEKVYTCSVCKGTRTETLFKTGKHSYGAWETTGGAAHQRACTVCGDTETENHTYNAGVITVQPNCTQTGTRVYTCAICGGTKTEALATNDAHDFVNCAKIDDETHEHTCSLCGKYEIVPHDWDKGTITLMPTKDTTGLIDHICLSCGAEATKELPVLIAGDVDFNYTVDTDDVIQLLLHASMPDFFPIQTDADFDGDSVVTTEDAIKLLLHISMPEMFPL